MTAAGIRSLLYISAVQSQSGDGVLSLQSRINIGVLSRDFEVSLAVVGPVTVEGLHRLRVDCRVPAVRRAHGAASAAGAAVVPSLRW